MWPRSSSPPARLRPWLTIAMIPAHGAPQARAADHLPDPLPRRALRRDVVDSNARIGVGVEGDVGYAPLARRLHRLLIGRLRLEQAVAAAAADQAVSEP